MRTIAGSVTMNGVGNLAKMTAKGYESVIEELENLEKNIIPLFKQAVYKGAQIAADEVKAGLEHNLRDPSSVSLKGRAIDVKKTRPTGDLLESFGVAPIKRDADGNVNTKIGFHGYDRKHAANQVKARAMESGTSRLRKRPFVRPALNRCRKRVKDAMGATLKSGLADLQKKG